MQQNEKPLDLTEDGLERCPRCGASPCESFIGGRCKKPSVKPNNYVSDYYQRSDILSVEQSNDHSCLHCSCYHDGGECCDCGVHA